MNDRDRRLSSGLLLAIAVVTVAPLFTVELLPFTDLREHVAVMASLRHWFDPAWRVREHHVLALGESQYLLYHAVGALLSYVTGSAESANRLLLGGVGLAFPFALRSLLRAMGKDERLAIFGCPLFWNRALLCGFLPYVASVPLLLYVLAEAVREADQPKTGRTVRLLFLATALFYLHASAFMLLVVIAPAVVLASRMAAADDGPWWWRLVAALPPLSRRLLWLVPSVVCAAAWTVVGKMTIHGESLGDDGEIGRMNALRSAHAFTLWAHNVWWSHVDEWCAVAYWALFLLLLVRRIRAGGESVRLLDPAYLPFVCTVLLYFVLPFRIGAGVMLNVRLAPVLAVFAVLALPAARLLWDRWIVLGVAAISLVVAFDAAHEMRAIVREDVAGISELIDKTKPGARLVLLSFKIDSPRSHFPPWVHVGAYHRARRGGVASPSPSSDTGHSTTRRPRHRPPNPRRSGIFSRAFTATRSTARTTTTCSSAGVTILFATSRRARSSRASGRRRTSRCSRRCPARGTRHGPSPTRAPAAPAPISRRGTHTARNGPTRTIRLPRQATSSPDGALLQPNAALQA